jgi:cytochrome c biogenesis protein CcdA
MAVNDTTTLTTLLPSTNYLLPYAIPLLLLSLLLTFAGAFLTLDRSRSFPAERYGVLPGAFDQKKRIQFLLEGGVGGLAIGYAFGRVLPPNALSSICSLNFSTTLHISLPHDPRAILVGSA